MTFLFNRLNQSLLKAEGEGQAKQLKLQMKKSRKPNRIKSQFLYRKEEEGRQAKNQRLKKRMMINPKKRRPSQRQVEGGGGEQVKSRHRKVWL